MNETAITGSDIEMQRNFAKNFNIDVVEGKNKLYDVVVEAPNGKRVLDFDVLKCLDK